MQFLLSFQIYSNNSLTSAESHFKISRANLPIYFSNETLSLNRLILQNSEDIKKTAK